MFCSKLTRGISCSVLFGMNKWDVGSAGLVLPEEDAGGCEEDPVGPESAAVIQSEEGVTEEALVPQLGQRPPARLPEPVPSTARHTCRQTPLYPSHHPLTAGQYTPSV